MFKVILHGSNDIKGFTLNDGCLHEDFDVYFATIIKQMFMISFKEEEIMIVGEKSVGLMNKEQQILKTVSSTFTILRATAYEDTGVCYCLVLSDDYKVYTVKFEDSDEHIPEFYPVLEFRREVKGIFVSPSTLSLFVSVDDTVFRLKLSLNPSISIVPDSSSLSRVADILVNICFYCC